MIIRPAELRDCAEIAAIWNPIIRDTAITFNPNEKSVEDLQDMVKEKRDKTHGFLVAETDRLVGFATYGPFRNGLGYRYTAEHTIILTDAARGQGVGRALMDKLEEHAASHGICAMFAGVSSGNPGGVAFHERLGYSSLVVLKDVGYKFDRWFDLTILQKRLSGNDIPDKQA